MRYGKARCVSSEFSRAAGAKFARLVSLCHVCAFVVRPPGPSGPAQIRPTFTIDVGDAVSYAASLLAAFLLLLFPSQIDALVHVQRWKPSQL